MEWLVIVPYSLALLFIFVFSLSQLNLTWHYLKSKKNQTQAPSTLKDYPYVTVQLPIYNEKYVVERLLIKVAQFVYPKDKLEIQVLDDSTDETVELTAALVEKLQNTGLDIQHIRRPTREGFKAGALQYGMQMCKGEFIAIFDSDFLPEPDFLLKTLPQFEANIGVVQTRWGHLNRDYSLLTELQAFGLDAHFSVEQTGRNHANSFINFNGTGGVWRKECINDAGGWSADTLTEDLDLSYRAQLKGWKFKYLEDCVAPAELPVIMSAVKSQQYRWNKGAAETAKKNLGKVLKSDLGFGSKIHAVFHLFNSSVFVCLLIASLLSIPMLFIKDANPRLELLFDIGSVFLLGFFSITFFYWVATKNTLTNYSSKYFFKIYPMFLTVSMGLSLHNGLAVLEGLFGFKSEFIRTPKFNIKSKTDSWVNNTYIKPKLNLLILSEAFLSFYFFFGVSSGIFLKDWGLVIFHLMLAIGFAMVFYHSIKSLPGAASAK
ncbi:cellulose synthase family protein [Fulvivirga lutea]|uniref:Glycosyltransferase family 2 protein n=1 Tax=Fulvivirga lutea TaxID=2810512 RepID=A0A974WHX8_9BACT|nr:cellulose synthase family protein [Fulvivirga lutea]QSE97472.1 glycosyltransferase family 2 protein [Fulvivirga lutea]